MILELEKEKKFHDLKDGTLVKIISDDEMNGKIAMKVSGIYSKRNTFGEQIDLDEVEAILIGDEGHWNTFDCGFEVLSKGDKITVKEV